MELSEAGRRILGQHWRLVVGCVLVGLAVAALVVHPGVMYTASARLVLDVPDPQTNAETAGVADTASAIATSPAEVAAAMRSARVSGRDPAWVGFHAVSVASLGQSSVLSLSVADRDPRVAAVLANALAQRVIAVRLAVVRGQISRVSSDLDRRISSLNEQIGAAQVAADQLTIQEAQAGSPGAVISLRARQSEAVRRLDLLNQSRSSLESERVSLLSSSAQQRQPQVISPASVPKVRDATGFGSDLVLGGVIGLVVGIALASVVEALRPKLIGSEAVARELRVPLLGSLSTEPAGASAGELGPLALRLLLAGKSAGLANVRLVAVREGTDLAGFAQWLDECAPNGAPAPAPEPVWAGRAGVAAAAPHGDAHEEPAGYRIGAFDPASVLMNGSKLGLVLVSPDRLAKRELDSVGHMLATTPGTLLGVVTYRTRRVRLGSRANHNQP
jgi:capsular polysaccharide biosynthesis protein